MPTANARTSTRSRSTSAPPTGAVAAAFAEFPARPRKKLLQVRELIIKTAAQSPEIGELVETLKWGQPSYLPKRARIGTTIRLGWSAKTPDQCHMFVHCQTSLVDTYRTLVGDELTFEGNRAIVLSTRTRLPSAALKLCIRAALTYHLTKL